MLALNVALHKFSMYPDWLKAGCAVNMPTQMSAPTIAKSKSRQKPVIKAYQYSYLSSKFKVIVMNFEPKCELN
jgi:hypothetical protein